MLSGTSVNARLARATSWAIIGNGLQQTFAMLAAIGTARLLGDVGFGEFGAVRSTTFVFGILAGSGLGLTSTRYVASLRTSDPERAGRVITVVHGLAWMTTIAAAVICIVFAGPIAEHVMKDPKLTLPLIVSAFALVFTTIGGVQGGVLAGCEDFRSLAVILAIEGFFTGFMTVMGAWLGGVTAAVAGYVLAGVLVFFLRARQVNVTCRRANIPRVPFREAPFRDELPIIRSFVLPATLLSIGTQPAEWIARMLLVQRPNGMAQLGVFTAAYLWANVVQFLPNQIGGTALPILSNVLAAGDRHTFRRTLITTALTVFAVSACIAIPLALLSKWIMRLYGSSFENGAEVLVVIVLAYTLGAVTNILRMSSLSAGHAWLQFVLSLAWGIALPVGFLLMREQGALALATSYGLAFVLLVFLQLATTWYQLRSSKRRSAEVVES